MDLLTLLDKRHDCIAEAPTPCTDACPLGLDVRDFIRKIRTGLYSAAYKTFARYAVLPGVVCHICNEPCQTACVRSESDEAIALRELEQYCWQQTRAKPAESYYSPPKKERILIIGGGISGLASALKLAERRYPVELVEQSPRLGGRLWDIAQTILPPAVLHEELDRVAQTKHLNITLNKQIDPHQARDYLSEFDAVLVTTGAKDHPIIPAHAAATGMHWDNGVFYAGSILNPDQPPLDSIAQGAGITYLIEEHLKMGQVSAVRAEKARPRYKPDLSQLERLKKPSPEAGQWTADEAKSEAQRCLQCACANCSDVCMMMQHYHKKFKKLTSEVIDTVVSTRIEEKKTALYPIMSCTQCGSCTTACPADIDIKRLYLESRRALHQRSQLPDAHYEYWLNDMRHANSDEAALYIPATSMTTDKPTRARYIYFPGCQMGASNPAYVTQTYRWLSETFAGSVSLLLYCCGAPALWSGNVEIHQDVIDTIHRQWRENGEQTVIVACPTCAEMFSRYLPAIETVTLWELLATHDTPANQPANQTVSIFDPCTSQNDTQTQKHIRTLITKAGYRVAELEKRADEALCCGYGGLIYTTNPALFKQIGTRNQALSAHEYITYCTNCQDNFTIHNKPSRHILDIVFGENQDTVNKLPASSQVPNLSERRSNRTAVKKHILNEVLKVDYEEPVKPYDQIKLILTPEIKAKMDAQLILKDNIQHVIAHAESTGKMLSLEGTDWIIAHTQQGNLTFWVKYKPVPDGYAVANVYYHRLSIVEA